MRNRPVFILLLVFICTTPILAHVSEVKFSGLKRTKKSFLMQMIKTTVGEPYSAEKVKEDVQVLRNLGLFSRVASTVQDLPEGKRVTFEVKEWFARLPIFNFGGIKKNFWFDLGVKDFNWLGRGYHLGGFYRYYDRHSLATFLRMPHLGNSRWGMSVNASIYSTTEPAYFGYRTTFYDVDRWELILGIMYHISNSFYLHFTGGYLGETYKKNVKKSGEGAPGPGYRKFDKWLTRLQIILEKVDYMDIFLKGVSNDLTLEQVTTVGEPQRFWKVLNIFKAYMLLGDRGNVAFRARKGIASNEDSPFVPFVLDSYLTVRGVGNRVARGTAELTFNVEYRHFLLEQKWAAIQGVAFLDWSAWRPAGGTFKEFFESDNLVTFGGLGVRLYLRKIRNLVLRIDLGVSLNDSTRKGVVVGIGHYF